MRWEVGLAGEAVPAIGFRQPPRPVPPRVLRLYAAWSVVRTCRLASGVDRHSELIEVEW